MKKLPLIFLFIGLVVGFISCSEEDENWNEYKEWRNTNNAWLTEQESASILTVLDIMILFAPITTKASMCLHTGLTTASSHRAI